MPTDVAAVLILIASPGDVEAERAAVRDRLNDWSVNTGRRLGVVALPWLWEKHAVAQLGGRPQALLNAQAVDRADVVVAFFDSRLGTDTGVDVSGTAEEIHRALGLGKPVHVYFSSGDLPRDADLEQLAALRQFKSDLEAEGLLGDYVGADDLASQVVRAVEADIEAHGWGQLTSAPAPAASGAKLVWEHAHVKEPNGITSGGRQRTRTLQNDLVVRNDSDTDAENLSFTVEPNDPDGDKGYVFDGPAAPVTVYGHSVLQWPLMPLRPSTVRITAEWTEQGQPRNHVRTVLVQ